MTHALVDHGFHPRIQARMLSRLIGFDPIRFVAAGEIALMGFCAASELCQK